MFTKQVMKYMMRVTKLKPQNYDFMDLVRAPTGSQIPITVEEKEKINLEIDRKMQELEDTGLSREQILLSKAHKGIPLAIDPFFQFLKRNKLAREVYLNKNDRFTTEKIIDIALRQDIGPDPSYSNPRFQKFINPKGRAEHMGDLEERRRQSFNPASYYSGENTKIGTLYDELKPHQPVRHIFKPMTRYEKLRKHTRKLKKYDIHWRNVELLRQFLTVYGNIKNRWANSLSPADQKKVTMAIKASRQNCAIPHYGKMLPTSKRNITNIDDEVKEIGLQNISLETGHIYFSRSRSMDSLQTELQHKSDLDYRYDQIKDGKDFYKIWYDEREKAPQELVKSEQYARSLKQKENQFKGKEGQEKKKVKRIAFKKLTGISEIEDQMKVKPSKDDESQQAYLHRKEKIKSQLHKNPFRFSEILLEEKTSL